MSESKEIEPIAIDIPEVCRRASLGRTLIYNEISNGRLPTLRVGRRRLVLLEDLKRFLAERRQAA
jgi:excisionase family DNA binding protein